MRSDSQLIVNSINEKLFFLKYISNLVKDISVLSSFFGDIIIVYCNRLINKETDAMEKVTIDSL